MTYETIFTKSFSCREQKKMGRRAILGCVVMAFALCIVLKPYLIGPLPVVNLELSVASGLKMLMLKREISQPQQSYIRKESANLPNIRNFTNSRSEVYEISGDIRIHGNSSTIFIISSTQQHNSITTCNFTTTPYPRKGDNVAMRKARKFKIINQQPPSPHCTRNYSNTPAIIFSTGGYAGNLFHDFSDVLIPLYLTSQRFKRKVLFLASDKHSWWTSKFRHIVNQLSEYEVVDIDNENRVLCFSRMIVGLKAHKNALGINYYPSESPSVKYSIRDFTMFLRATYSLDRESIIITNGLPRRKPRLLIISRKKTRHMTNERQVVNMARSLGFDVDVREMEWQVAKVAKFVNTFDVMVGVHGAGITNMVFLPENAIVIEIVPFGLDMLSKHYYEIPSRAGIRSIL